MIERITTWWQLRCAFYILARRVGHYGRLRAYWYALTA